MLPRRGETSPCDPSASELSTSDSLDEEERISFRFCWVFLLFGCGDEAAFGCLRFLGVGFGALDGFFPLSAFFPLATGLSASWIDLNMSGDSSLGPDGPNSLIALIILLSDGTLPYIDSGIEPMKENFDAAETMIFVVWNVPIEDIDAPSAVWTSNLSIAHLVIKIQNRASDTSECREAEERL